MEKIDLRKIGKKEISPELLTIAEQEIKSLNKDSLLEVSLTSYGELYLLGKDKNGVVRSSEWDLKDYLKHARKYDKLKDRLDKERRKYGLENYAYEELYQLSQEESYSVSGKLIFAGLKNRVKTLTKILKRDKETKMNKIETTQANLEQLRKLKFEAFDSGEEYAKLANIDIDKYKITKGKNKGKFRSKKLEKEFYKEFSERTMDEDYDKSGEFGDFFGDVWLNYVDDLSGETTKEYWSKLTQEERIQHFKEYIGTSMDSKIDIAVNLGDEDTEAELKAMRETLKGRK